MGQYGARQHQGCAGWNLPGRAGKTRAALSRRVRISVQSQIRPWRNDPTSRLRGHQNLAHALSAAKVGCLLSVTRKEIDFETKPEIALKQIKAACEAGLPRGVVLMDAGYGCNTDLRTGISALKLAYVAGILPNTTVWMPGTGPLPPKKWSGRGQPPTRLRREQLHKPVSD